MGVLALHLSDREKGWWLLFALIVQGFASWFCPYSGGTEFSLVSPRNSEVMGEIDLFYLRKRTKGPPGALGRLQPGRRAGPVALTGGQGSTRVALASSASTVLVTAWRMDPLWISSPFLM